MGKMAALLISPGGINEVVMIHLMRISKCFLAESLLRIFPPQLRILYFLPTMTPIRGRTEYYRAFFFLSFCVSLLKGKRRISCHRSRKHFINIHYAQFTVQQGHDYKTVCIFIFQRFILSTDRFLKRKGREEIMKLEEEQREKGRLERYGGGEVGRDGEGVMSGGSSFPQIHLQKYKVCQEFCFKIEIHSAVSLRYIMYVCYRKPL